jgi:phosphoglycolate phosphatase
MQDGLMPGHTEWPDAVVFDLDGTLIDSAGDIASALNAALAKRGLAPFTVPQVTDMIGGGIPKLVERALLAHGVSRIGLMPLATDFLRIYRDNLVVKTVLFDGAREMLESLRGQNKRLGLCTNKQHELTIEILKQLDIAHYFSAVIGERLGRPRKPDPAPLRGILTALGVQPKRAVMVGDSAADVGCARAANVACVVVSFGYSKVAPAQLGADTVIGAFSELPKAFETLIHHQPAGSV